MKTTTRLIAPKPVLLDLPWRSRNKRGVGPRAYPELKAVLVRIQRRASDSRVEELEELINTNGDDSPVAYGHD